MGFWHTGYMEFHEPTGMGDEWAPEHKAPEFPCPDCGLVFATERDQRAHRFDGHSTRRPMLVFRGRECGRTRLMVTTPSVPSDWHAADVASISLNGRPSTVVDTAAYLSETKLGVQTVTVANGPLERTFEFDFCLAEDEDLKLVDQALEKLIAGRVLSLSTIDAFIMRAGRGETARRYREGLANYLYGVLAREGNDDRTQTDSSGEQLYEQRYNRAVDVLGAFDRPAAEAICGLVALHYNQFDLAIRKTNSHRVSDVAARFSSMMTGSRFVTSSLLDRTHGSFDQALSDSVTEELIAVGAMALDGTDQSPLDAVLDQIINLRPADQFKVRLIASEALLAGGDVDGATRHSEALRNYRDADAWYAGFRARLQEVGR
jgi:predicted RNA-binding Zn-ribbon protein involved in translation (DUF1610 family)